MTTTGGEQLKQCHSDVGIKVPPYPHDEVLTSQTAVQHGLSTTLVLMTCE